MRFVDKDALAGLVAALRIAHREQYHADGCKLSSEDLSDIALECLASSFLSMMAGLDGPVVSECLVFMAKSLGDGKMEYFPRVPVVRARKGQP